MRVDRTYIAENDAERARLRALVTRLTDADLARPMPAGWTVAAILAHLAFWDQRALLLLEQWERSGLLAMPRGLNGTDVPWINDAAKPMFLALAPRAAADLAVAIAEAVDGKVAALGEDFVARSTAAGTPVSLLRAEHRREHLDEIEAALQA
jgi:DinB family protein